MTARIGAYPLPRDDGLVDKLAAAIARLRVKLGELDLAGLGISDYSRRYLDGSYANGLSKLNLYGYLMYLAIRDVDLPLQAFGIVDYGGGNGLLSLLAREAGIGTVIYDDIYDLSTADAQRLGLALGLEADRYVTGDIEDLITHLRGNMVPCRAICSYDVIEHVYDITAFLTAVPRVSDGPLRVVMASGANGANPRIRRTLMKMQRQVEREDRVADPGHKERDELRAYRDVRAEMIRSFDAGLALSTVEELADLTRGLIESDISAAVATFVAEGVYPPGPSDQTNTCDPRTGNWAEHLMDPSGLAEVLSTAGFDARVIPGYYNPYRGTKGSVATVLNAVIRIAGGPGLAMAPYYVLLADRS